MNRFNLDPVFTLTLRRVDKGYISNLVSLKIDDKIETEIASMTEYKDAKNVLQRFLKPNEAI